MYYRRYNVEIEDHAYRRYIERGGMKTLKKLDAKIRKIVNEILRGNGLQFNRYGTAFIDIDGGYLAVLCIERGVLVVRTIIYQDIRREDERVAAC